MDIVKMCSRCVMDTTIPGTYFDEEGICNHCKGYFELERRTPNYDGYGEEKLLKVMSEIREKGKNKKYDCIIGLSGGIDSSYVAYKVKELGLRPLAIHLDNGWNSVEADENVINIVKKLKIDLRTIKIDWEEFKDLQVAFLKASVPHCEHPTDHAILAILYKTASEEGIEYIISGSNISTEGIGVTVGTIGQRDWKYIKSIQKIFGTKKLKKYPHFSALNLLYYKVIKKQKTINILNYIQYNKNDVMNFLANELEWKYYGGKHYESIYTRFFQAYILPIKFSIDKRKAHLSTLICSGQISRDDALDELKTDPHPTDKLKEDKAYFLSNLNLKEDEFDNLMNLPIKSFEEYPSYTKSLFYKLIVRLYFFLKPILKF